MRAAQHIVHDEVRIISSVTVGTDGAVITSTVTTSHGNAEHKALFQLTEWGAGEWAVTEPSTGVTLFVALSKTDAIDKIGRRVRSDAARWAIG